MQLAPFLPMGNSFIINTNATPSTAQTTPCYLTGTLQLNLGDMQPNMIRMLNKGTADIWVTLSSGATATNAAIPTPGTTSTGTTQPSFWVEPGVDLIFTMPVIFQFTANSRVGFFISTISTVASQPLYCQLGEGA